MTLQWFPTAITPEGISSVTILRAPMTTSSPMLMPGKIITPAPNQTLLYVQGITNQVVLLQYEI